MAKSTLKAELNTGTLFLELMFLMFLGLKISGLIDWSWWWVFAPIWIPFAGGILVLGILFLYTVFTVYVKGNNKKK